MATQNLDLVFTGPVKRILFTTSSDGAIPNFTASEAREVGGIMNVSIVGTPSVVRFHNSRMRERNSRYVTTIELLQAGQSTVDLFETTFADKKVFVGIETWDNNFYHSTGSGLYLSPMLELNLGAEGDSKLTLTGEVVARKPQEVYVTPDANTVSEVTPTTNIDNTQIFHGPISEVSWSQSSGSNYTGSGEFSSENALFSWTPQVVEIHDGQKLVRNGVGRVQFELLQTGTGSADEILDVYKNNRAHFRFLLTDGSVISTHISGGMELSMTVNRSFEGGETHHNYLIEGEVVTDKIQEFVNLPV